MLKPYLFIELSPGKGKGVFTCEKIPAQTIIEVAPVIVMLPGDRLHLDMTKMHEYIFEWGKKKDGCAMALGYIPIYNHSYSSNCEYFMNYEEETIMVKTVRIVKKGEELTINYNGDWNNLKKLWFESI